MKSSSGQAPILAAVLFLFLVPTTIIIAQNASGNLTGDIVANLSLLNATPAGDPAAESPAESHLPNQTLPGNGSLTIPNATVSGNGSSTDIQTNATAQANPTESGTPENATANQTLPAPSGQEQAINVTPAIKTTIPGQAPQGQANWTEKKPLGALLELTLDIPDSTDRNQPFTISAILTNAGDREASNAEIEWVLPEGLSVTSGSGTMACDIAPGESCRSDLEVVASLSSALGENEIKAIVRYIR